MSKFSLIQLLQTAEDEATAILAIRRLKRYLDDPAIMKLLCAFAVATENANLRSALLETLECRIDAAADQFVRYARRARNPRIRRWALTNLGLLERQSNPAAILEGLLDSDKSVRLAAASNAGLYRDPAVLSALADYYEKHRFNLVLAALRQGVRNFMLAAQGETEDRASSLALTQSTT